MSLAGGDQKNPSIAKPAKTDFTVIVWEDYSSGGESNIYAQLIENTHGIAVWNPIDGIPVCTAQGEQRNPRAAYDEMGGVIITWEDYRNDPAGLRSEIYAQRIIIATGIPDLNWSTNGNPVCAGTGYKADRPRIVGTTDGAYITWNDYRLPSRNVYIQYILSSTGQWPIGGANVWVQNGIKVSNMLRAPARNSELVLDNVLPPGIGKSGVVITYEVNLEVWQVHATNIDATGQFVWRDVQIAPTFYNQWNPQLEFIQGNPDFVITWEDERHSNNTTSDIYAQKISISGNLAWQGGVAICIAHDEQVLPKVAVYNPTYAVIAWEDQRDSSTTGRDIYANRLDLSNGNVYSNTGTAICISPGDQWHHCLEIVDGIAIIGWEDWRTSLSNIYFQEVNVATWTQQRQVNGWPATLAKGNQTLPDVGKKVFAWEDNRRIDLNIYAQKIGGECTPSNGMQWQDVFAKWTPGTVAMNHRFVTDGSGNKYVVWMEDRVVSQSGIEGPEIYAQKFDVDGVPLWMNDGVLVSDPNAASDYPDICVGPGYGAWIAWRQITPGALGPEIRLAQIDGTGGLSGYGSVFNGLEPRIVEDDAGNAWVTFVSLDRVTLNIIRTLAPPVVYTYTNIPPPILSVPKISKDRMNGCWVIVTEGAGYTIVKPTLAVPPSTIFFAGIGGAVDYDICTDLIPDILSLPAEPYNALIGITKPVGAVTEVSFERYLVTPIFSIVFVATVPLTTNVGSGDLSSSASICADGVTTAGNRGGALVSWHTRVAATGFNKVEAQSVTDVDAQRWMNPLDRNMSMGPWNSEFPDVAKMSGTTVSTSTYVMLTWKDTRSINCGGISNIFVQLLDVLAIPPAHRMWTPNGKALSPSMGAQQEPMIQESSEYTGSIFWIDERTGSRCVVGTRIHADVSGTLAKRVDSDPDHSSSEVKKFILEQNYPNPFNPITTINFNIPRDNYVRVELYNAFGQMVRVLVDQQLEHGSYSFTLDGTNLPAGIYFYRLTYENSSEFRKMTVVK